MATLSSPLAPPHAAPGADCSAGGSGGSRRVDDFVNRLARPELTTITSELKAGESVRWAARPQQDFWELESAGRMSSGIIGCLFVLGLVWQADADSFPISIALGLSLPLLCGLFWHIAAPWRRLRRLRRTLYIITQHRALLSEPTLFGWKVRGWQLREGMIIQREVGAGKQGALVFSRETVYPTFGRSYLQDAGFLCLADLERAERELRAAIDATRPL